MIIKNCTVCPDRHECPFHHLERMLRILACYRLPDGNGKTYNNPEFDLPSQGKPEIFTTRIPGRKTKLQLPEDPKIWHPKLRDFLNERKQ